MDSRINGSVANGTICTIPNSIEKINECSNGENPYSFCYAAPPCDALLYFSPQPINLECRQISKECSASNKHFPENMDNNLGNVKSSFLQNAVVPMTYDEKVPSLQHKKHNFVPLHVNCDPVGNSITTYVCLK